MSNEQAQNVAARVVLVRNLRRELANVETNGAKQQARDLRRQISTAESEIDQLIATEN